MTRACKYSIIFDVQYPRGYKNGGIAQLARAFGSYPKCHWFKSSYRYQKNEGEKRTSLFPPPLYGPLVKWLRHRPFTAATRVRISYGSPVACRHGHALHGLRPYRSKAVSLCLGTWTSKVFHTASGVAPTGTPCTAFGLTGRRPLVCAWRHGYRKCFALTVGSPPRACPARPPHSRGLYFSTKSKWVPGDLGCVIKL